MPHGDFQPSTFHASKNTYVAEVHILFGVGMGQSVQQDVQVWRLQQKTGNVHPMVESTFVNTLTTPKKIMDLQTFA